MKEKSIQSTKLLDESGKALGNDPFSSQEDVLAGFYYPTTQKKVDKATKVKPEHYKIVCISLYQEDIQLLTKLVKDLKKKGHTKANKSQVIRYALDQIDLDKIPMVR